MSGVIESVAFPGTYFLLLLSSSPIPFTGQLVFDVQSQTTPPTSKITTRNISFRIEELALKKWNTHDGPPQIQCRVSYDSDYIKDVNKNITFGKSHRLSLKTRNVLKKYRNIQHRNGQQTSRIRKNVHVFLQMFFVLPHPTIFLSVIQFLRTKLLKITVGKCFRWSPIR